MQDPGKILTEKKQKRVVSISSWERGKNITALCVMNGMYGFIPPHLFIQGNGHLSLGNMDQ